MYGVRTIYSTNHRKELLTTMKLICSKSNLLHGVNIVSKAVPTRTTMAILECILIDASANEIKLTANDMELGIETKIEGEIAERGVIALDAKIFSEIVRKLPDSDVVIETDASFKTTITCEKAKFNIVGKSGDDFSYIPYIERNEAITLSQFTLKEVIRQTIFSIADNDNNKLMTGELFEIEENHLKVVSLDGHRISIRNIELKNNYEHKKVVVPGKTLSEVLKLLKDSEGEAEICPSRRHILFRIDNYTVISALLEGEFLDYKSALPKDKKTEVTVSTRTMIESVERVSLLITDRLKSPVRCVIGEDTVKLFCTTTMGRATDQISAEISGDQLEIGFNNKYLLDALRAAETDEVRLQLDARSAEGGRRVFVPRPAGAPAQRNVINVSHSVYCSRTSVTTFVKHQLVKF
mgnify:CR=1 FL=1